MMGGGYTVPFIRGRNERVRIPGAAPQGAPEPPEPGYLYEDRTCAECASFRVPDDRYHGVCSREVARFCDEEVENMPKWTSVNAAIDWVLGNLRGRDDMACEEFEERED